MPGADRGGESHSGFYRHVCRSRRPFDFEIPRKPIVKASPDSREGLPAEFAVPVVAGVSDDTVGFDHGPDDEVSGAGAGVGLDSGFGRREPSYGNDAEDVDTVGEADALQAGVERHVGGQRVAFPGSFRFDVLVGEGDGFRVGEVDGESPARVLLAPLSELDDIVRGGFERVHGPADPVESGVGARAFDGDRAVVVL